MKTQKIIDHISREFINLSHSDWLQLAADCIAVTGLQEDYETLRTAKRSLSFAAQWEKEKNEKVAK